MIETLSGTSAGSPTELKTMNSPRRSIFACMEILIGGSIGTSPSPCHSPISGWNSFIVGLLFRGSRSNNKTRPEARTHRPGTAWAPAFAGAIGEASLGKVAARCSSHQPDAKDGRRKPHHGGGGPLPRLETHPAYEDVRNA